MKKAKNHYQFKGHHSFILHMLKERNIYLACSRNYSRKGTGRLSTLVSKFQLCQAVTVTVKRKNLFQIACSMHLIRKIYETLHVCEEISKLKYSLVCYAPLTSFRTLNGGVVRRVYCSTQLETQPTLHVKCPLRTLSVLMILS